MILYLLRCMDARHFMFSAAMSHPTPSHQRPATFFDSESERKGTERNGTKLIRSLSNPIHSVPFCFNNFYMRFVPFRSIPFCQNSFRSVPEKISAMFRSVPFRFIGNEFVSFRFYKISDMFRSVPFRSISFEFVPFRFQKILVMFRFDLFLSVPFEFVPFRSVSTKYRFFSVSFCPMPFCFSSFLPVFAKY